MTKKIMKQQMQNLPILSLLPKATLEIEAGSMKYPKWNTLCLLRLLIFPTLDAAIITPDSSQKNIKHIIREFADFHKADRIMIRSDGGQERTQYRRGGNSHPISEVIDIALHFIDAGRAVILMEPTNRFQNRLTVNFLASREGKFTIEILGPGYDTADLNRGRVRPQYIIQGDVGSWVEYKELRITDITITKIELCKRKRIAMRLNHLGTYILPAAGIDVSGEPEAFAEQWLRKRGYIELWADWSYSFGLSQIQRWYGDAFIIAAYFRRQRPWKAFVLSWSQLWDYREVYWDVVDSEFKYRINQNQVDSRICHTLKESPPKSSNTPL